MLALLKIIALIILGVYVIAWATLGLSLIVVFLQHYIRLGFALMFKP